MSRIKYFTAIIVSVNCYFTVSGQTKGEQPNFRNKWEQEAYEAEQVFNNTDGRQHFEKYKGRIVKVDSNTFTYGDKTLIVSGMPAGLKMIFETGVFYPAIISGDFPAGHKSIQELNAMSQNEKIFYAFIRSDTMGISSVEEIPLLLTPAKCRRYRFLLWKIGMANPRLCFLELTNEHANSATPIDLFIKEATVTFFKEHSILI